MILLILKVIIYYLVIGALFTLVVCHEIESLADNLKSSDDDFSDIPEKDLQKQVVIMFTLLWPVFAYQISKRDKL